MCRTVLRVVLQLATNQLMAGGATPPRPLQPGRTLCMCSPHASSHRVGGRRHSILQNEYFSLISMGPTRKPVARSNNGYSSKKNLGGRFDFCQKLLLFLKASLCLKCFIWFYLYIVFKFSVGHCWDSSDMLLCQGLGVTSSEPRRVGGGRINACTVKGTSS